MLSAVATPNLRSKRLTTHAMSLDSAVANAFLSGNFEELWKLLEHCASSPDCGTVILLIDTLDECSKPDRDGFVKALERFFTSTKAFDGSINLKFLVTSQPWESSSLIRRLTSFSRTPHLSPCLLSAKRRSSSWSKIAWMT